MQKKNKRLIAGMLAAALVFSTFVGDFSKFNATETNKTETETNVEDDKQATKEQDQSTTNEVKEDKKEEANAPEEQKPTEDKVSVKISFPRGFEPVSLKKQEKESYKFPDSLNGYVDGKEIIVSVKWDNSDFLETDKTEYRYIPSLQEGYEVDGVLPELQITIQQGNKMVSKAAQKALAVTNPDETEKENFLISGANKVIGSATFYSFTVNGHLAMCDNMGRKGYNPSKQYQVVNRGTGAKGWLVNRYSGVTDFGVQFANWYINENGEHPVTAQEVEVWLRNCGHKSPMDPHNLSIAVAQMINDAVASPEPYVILSCGDSAYQNIVAPDGDYDGEYIAGTLTIEVETEYKVEIQKDSVITNEKLDGISFDIKEEVADDAGSSEVCGNCTETVTTDANGHAEATFKHSATFTGPDAQEEADKFLAIKYSYNITEKAGYTHFSGEGLPKLGYRMGVSGVTTPSVQTSDACGDGETVQVDFTNEPWYNQLFINKTDLESGNQIFYDAIFDIYENNSGTTSASYGAANQNYECVRVVGSVAAAMGVSESDGAYGMYTVHRKSATDAYTGTTFSGYEEYGTLYFTQKNQGLFAIVERNAPHNGTKNGYINNLTTRPYTKLNGKTDKTYPAPIDVADDIASVRAVHSIRLCQDTNQYKVEMLVDGYNKYNGNYYSNTDEAAKAHQYDSTSHNEIETTLSKSDIIFYDGEYDETKINYNSYSGNASTLNARKGYNGSHMIETSAPTRDEAHAYINERQYGFIRLTKFDIEAGRYVDGSEKDNYRDGTHHGDGDLDGAVYSLYVADTNEDGGILHPDGREDGAKHDGKYAVLEEQQIFVDTDGDGYPDTWQTHDATLTNGTKVASAQIRNGELEFDGLYLGDYYIVEEIRDVIDIQSYTNDGNENVETRKLSFAPGYYVETDENNEVVRHDFSFDWSAETGSMTANSTSVQQTYVHKNTTDVTYQQVIKGGIQLAKITQGETIGSGSTNVGSLEGAGFSVFLISELSKVVDGTIKPAYSIEEGHAMIERGELVRRFDSAKQFVGYKLADASKLPNPNANNIVFVAKYGYFFESDILAAYINQEYSNIAKKWDFTGESQALARTYEDHVEDINEQNAKYVHVPNHKGPNGTDSEWFGQDGIGDGYLSYSDFVAKYTYTRKADDVQTAREWTLSELKTNVDGYIRTPLLPWGAYLMVETTVPNDKFVVDPMFVSITDNSPTIDRTEKYYQTDASIVENLHLVKRDAQTGQIVRAAHVKFRIWDYTDNRYISITQQNASGFVGQTNVFETGEDGLVWFPGLSVLEVGKYRIEEIEGPEGYWNAYWDLGNPNKNPGFPNETLGGVGTDKDNRNETNMVRKYFGTVDFEVTTDRKFQSSAIVTDNNLDCLYIGEYYSNAETLGKLTIMKTGKVLVDYDDIDNIQYADDEEFKQNKSEKKRSEIEALRKAYSVAMDTVTEGEGVGAAYTDSKTEAFYKYDDTQKDFVYETRPLADATYEITAAEDIYTQDNQYNEDGSRTTWFKKGDVVAVVTTANEGEIVDFVPYYNQGGEYDVKITKTGAEYTESYTADQFASSGRIENKWIESKMSELYKAIYGVPEFQDELIYPNSYINPQGERQCVVRVMKDGTLGEVSILLPLGSYNVREIKAPYGFILDQETVQTVTFEWADQIKEVVYNVEEKSVNDTKNSMNKFVEENLSWWLGGKNTINETVATRIGTYTEDFVGKGEDVYYKDEQGFIVFNNDRTKVMTKPQKEGATVYKINGSISFDDYTKDNEYVLTENDLKDGLHPEYEAGETVYKINDEILWLKGAKFELRASDAIYNVDGKKLVEKDQLLGTAITDSLGYAAFDVDIPMISNPDGEMRNGVIVYEKEINGETVYVGLDGNTVMNSGDYYVRELTPPAGYMLDNSLNEFNFPYGGQYTHYMNTYGLNQDKETQVNISKRDITNEEEVVGATMELYWVQDLVRKANGTVDQDASKLVKVEEWVSDGKDHVIKGLRYSNLEVPRLDNEELKENVYILKEKIPADGYVTASDIEFEVVQDYKVGEDGSIEWLQSNTIYVNSETTVDYIDGVIKAQDKYTDHDGDDRYNYNHDYIHYVNDESKNGEIVKDGCGIGDVVDGKVVANWTLVNGTLIIDVEEDATKEALEKSMNAGILVHSIEERGGSVEDIEHIFFTTKSADAIFENYYTSTKIDLEGIDPGDIDPDFTTMGLMKYDIQEEETPFKEEMVVDSLSDEVKELLDMEALEKENPEVIVVPQYKWVSAVDAYDEAADTKTLGYTPTGEPKDNDEENYTLIMHDERAKLLISKRDITTGHTVLDATLTIKNLDGTVAKDSEGNELTWVTDGTDHYIERLPIGTYILEETMAPTEDGYVHTSSIKFVVEDDGHINAVYMPDNYTRLVIKKTDIVTSEEVPGATLVIKDEDGNVIAEWTTDGEEDFYIERIPDGKYTLTEVQAPTEDGYTTANTIEFEIKDGDVVTVVEMIDDFTVTQISKTDMVTGEEIAGAHLEIYRYKEDGKLEEKPVHSWISGYKYDENGKVVVDAKGNPVLDLDENGKVKPHMIEYLAIGKYHLVETQAPDGYIIASAIDFEVVDKLYHYEDDGKTVLRDEEGNVIANDKEIIKANMKDDFTKVEISKKDFTTKEEVMGAKLEIYKKENVVDKADGTFETKGKPERTWTSGYECDKDGNIVKDEKGNPKLSVDEKGNIIPHMIEKLPTGDYVLIETQAPDGYLVAEKVEFTVKDTGEIQKVEMFDERGLLISKQNMANSKEVIGAELKIVEAVEKVTENADGTSSVTYEASNKKVDEWKSGNKPHGVNIDLLEEGKVYALVETTAPSGYFKAETIFFKYEMKEGKVEVSVLVNKQFTVLKDNMVVMKDDHTTVDIHKVNEKGGFVKDAKLEIRTASGKTIATFTSKDSFTRVIALPAGNYQLVETAAPSGYQVASAVKFTVTEANTFANPVKVTMVDKEIPGHTHHDNGGSKNETPDKPAEVVAIQSGDSNNMLPFALAGGAAVALMAVVIVLSKKRKKDEETEA